MAVAPAEERRRAICAWLTENGINPRDVPEDADIWIAPRDGRPVIHYEAFVRTADGSIRADGDGSALTEHRTAPLLTEPPFRSAAVDRSAPRDR